MQRQEPADAQLQPDRSPRLELQPSLTIDVSDEDVDRIAGDVIRWMKEIGAFWWQG